MRILSFMVVLFALSVDQLSKWFFLGFLKQNPVPYDITPFLNIVSAWNRGVSFSLLRASTDLGYWFLVILTGGLCLFLIQLLRQSTTKATIIGYGLILGGALGNLLDRLRFGAVFDFIDFHLYNWHFYTFNGADTFITLGVILILGDYLFSGAHMKELKRP